MQPCRSLALLALFLSSAGFLCGDGDPVVDDLDVIEVPPECQSSWFGTPFQGACPDKWFSNGACDCGCQVPDLECPGGGLPAVGPYEGGYVEPGHQLYSSVKLLDNGPSADLIDIVFVSEGYQLSEMALFRSDVSGILLAFLDISDVSAAQARFNVWRVDLASNTEPGGDTAFDSYEDPPGCWVPAVGFRDVIEETTSDFTVMLVNDRGGVGEGCRPHGSTGVASIPVGESSNEERAAYTFWHFLQGKIGLRDERGWDGSGLPDPDHWPKVDSYSVPNLSNSFLAPKWADLIDESTYLPTPQGFFPAGTVGAFEGGGGWLHNVYHPTESCFMARTPGASLCPVCLRELWRRFEEWGLGQRG